MRRLMWYCVVLGLSGSLTVIASAEAACDIKKELLNLVLAGQRFHRLAATASIGDISQVTPPIPVTVLRLEARRAQVDYETQEDRAYYLCRSQLNAAGSTEQRIAERVRRIGFAARMLLLGKSDDPIVKGGDEAALELPRLAHDYFEK